MLLGTLAAFAARASLIVATAAASIPESEKQPVHRCGNESPSAELVDAHQKLELAKSNEQHQARAIDVNEVINIDLYAHVVMSDPSEQNLADDATLNKQVDVLNQAYQASKFRFNLKNTTRVNNATWALDDDGSIMRNMIRQGDQKAVNVYFLRELKGGPLGYAADPTSWGRNSLAEDYVYVATTTLPGSVGDYNEGATLVHEVGHWLGLVHPHQYGCDQGDFIDDTPAMAVPDYYCTQGLDTCPGAEHPGEDPVHNYMSYGADSCLTEFTPDQTKRMRDLWETFRMSKNEKELSWKADCQAALNPLAYDCLEDQNKAIEDCFEEFQVNAHLPCNPLAPGTKQECLDRFAPYSAKCHSDSCKADFARSYERYCAAERRVEQNPVPGQNPEQPAVGADRAWSSVCRQASILIREQCTKKECQAEMVRGSLFRRCARTPRDDKQCEAALSPLAQFCESDQCRRGLDALRSRECVARKDPAAEYNNGVVTEWDLNGDMAPMTSDQWSSRCNAISRAIVQSCQADKACVDRFRTMGLSASCIKSRPKARDDCRAVFVLKYFACPSDECIDKVTALEDKACAGSKPK